MAKGPAAETRALKAAKVGPTVGPLAAGRADKPDRAEPPTPAAPRLDPEIYRAQLMAAEEEALALFLADGGDPVEPEENAPSEGLAARPPEASGDRLLGAAVEAVEASEPLPAAAFGADIGEPTFRTAVRGGETIWRLAEWSDESIDAFRARNGLPADQSLPAGRTVIISAARVDPETFETRRAAYHEALREKAARQFRVVGTRPHRVASGETPWRLAETNGIPFWLLEQANEGRDLNAVRAGDTVLVPVIRTE